MKLPALAKAIALFCSVVSSVIVANAVHSAKPIIVSKSLQMAVGCLYSASWMRKYFFTSFGGFKEGEAISVRYNLGTISGTERTPGAYNVLFYSKDGKHAFLLDAEPNSRGGFFASENDYTLRQQGSKWHVIEGEGGFRDYEAVERLVNRMSSQPLYRVQLIPDGKECGSD